MENIPYLYDTLLGVLGQLVAVEFEVHRGGGDLLVVVQVSHRVFQISEVMAELLSLLVRLVGLLTCLIRASHRLSGFVVCRHCALFGGAQSRLFVCGFCCIAENTSLYCVHFQKVRLWLDNTRRRQMCDVSREVTSTTVNE